jgi:hypothetical protein
MLLNPPSPVFLLPLPWRLLALLRLQRAFLSLLLRPLLSLRRRRRNGLIA